MPILACAGRRCCRLHERGYSLYARRRLFVVSQTLSQGVGQYRPIPKTRPQTSPEWFYRYGCRALFEMARRIRPRALIATEVGCCELASLIKRDLGGDLPMVAVNSDPDADRSWVRPEVDLYCFVTEQSGRELLMHGAPPEHTKLWGPVLADGFRQVRNRAFDRRVVCRWLSLDLGRPIVLVAGGSEGLGDIEEITARLLGARRGFPR